MNSQIMTDETLLYEDRRADDTAREVGKALEHFGALLCSPARPLPGLPVLHEDQIEETRVTGGERCYVTAWGVAREIGYSDLSGLGYALYQYLPLFHLVEPGGAAPQAQTPRPGLVALDTITGMATVYLHDGEEAAHSLRIDLNRQDNSAYRLADQIRYGLARDGVPILPRRIYRQDSLPYPWQEKKHQVSTVRAMNREISVPVVGFALDDQTRELAYLHIVGAKAACRSIWATLNQGGRKVLSIVDGRDNHTAVSSKNYVTFSAPVDAESGVYRLVIVDRRAVERDVADGLAYLLVHGNETDLDALFAARLDAVLPIPVRPEWGRVLKVAGSRSRLVRHGTSGGDAAALYVLTADERWNELVGGLVQSGDLVL